MLTELINRLAQNGNLTEPETCQAVALLTREDVPVDQKADFLTALARKGETPDEIAGFARALRDKSIPPPLDAETRNREILDVCGTGGDHQNTFNISTTVALVAASAGVTVAKHGNRAVTSQSGSADVLEELGIATVLSPAAAAQSLREHGFAFLFAPNYHPAFKHIAPARKLCASRGQRTIFNLLGPLLNPARPTAQLIGVPDAALCEPMARVLQSLGIRRGMVVSGRFGAGAIDELSTIGDNTVAEFYRERGFTTSIVSPVSFQFQPAVPSDLKGGGREDNARIIVQILSGSDRGPKREAVLLNSGAALFIAGFCKSLTQGIDLAAEVIDSGKASAKLRALAAFRG